MIGRERSAAYQRRVLFAAACLAMLIFGIGVTTLGAILPLLMERFGADKAEAGSLFMLMSFGILIGSLVFGPVVDRHGYRALMVGCSLLVAGGLQGLAFAPSFDVLRLAVFAVGVGGGVINGGASALVADISEGTRSAGLSLLGVFFGVGAVGVPFGLALLLESFSYPALVAMTGMTVLLPVAFMATIRFPVPKHARGFPIREAARLLRDPALLLFGLMLFLQSGIEMTVGGWTATYYQERLGLAGSRALFFLSLFWLGLMLARLALGWVLRHVAAAPVLATSFAVAFAGSLLMIAAESLMLAAAGSFLLGVGFAAVFPVVLGYVADRYPALSGTAYSIVFVMALSGGMTLPYLTGITGEAYGLRSSFLLVPAALCALPFVFALALRLSRSAPAAAPTLPMKRPQRETLAR